MIALLTTLAVLLITVGSAYTITSLNDNKNNKFPVTELIVFIIGIFLIWGIGIHQSDEIDKLSKISNKQNNSIIKSNYNYKYNTFNIMYIKNNDTLALDDIYPYKLDSIINHLNK